ncbi:MAG: arylesterase [Rhodobacteraceae bacterium]|nr:arylesterase [Paracoccaceae bacterium]
MFTGPAFPAKVRLTSRSDRTGSVINKAPRHIVHNLAYGACAARRKLAAAALLVCAALAAGSAGPARAADPEPPVVIAALGDSLTQGYGLLPEDGLVPQLGRWLEAHGQSVRMINAGVSGDTTAGGAARIDWTLTPDVQALIVALGANDLLRGIDPATSRANLDRILATAQDRGLPVLLIGVAAPDNYGPDYKAAFDAIYPDLAARYDTLLIPDLLAPLRKWRTEDPVALAAVMQDDGLHPNRDGVALVVDAIGPEVARLVARAQAGP